jgi:hypothetical protein
VFKQILQERKLPSGVIITFQVMAFPGVSPAYPHPVRTVAQGRQNEFRAHPAGARNPDHPEIVGILKSAHSRQIRCPITAPVAQKRGYLRLPVRHFFSSFFRQDEQDYLKLRNSSKFH